MICFVQVGRTVKFKKKAEEAEHDKQIPAAV
jgi:hypothetical protein